MLYDSKTKAPTKVSFRTEGKSKVRISKKTGAVID
jgi:hypothetical protein